MNNLLKKGVPLEWKQEQEDAFQELKQAVQKEPVLLQPDQTKPFEVEIDCYVTVGTFARRGLGSTAKTLRSRCGV